MSKLDESLAVWTKQGFISAGQAKQIKDFEAAKPERSWLVTSVLILGAAIIAIGIISLIAANWSAISPGIKLTSDFLLLFVTAFAVVRAWTAKKGPAFEALLFFFMLLCLASIGLISQVFNTGGELYQALLLWAIITVGAVMASKIFATHFVWVGALLTGITFAAIRDPFMALVFFRDERPVFMAIPLLSALATVLCLNTMGNVAPTRAFRAWTILGGLLALVSSEVLGSDLIHYAPNYYEHNLARFVPGLILLLLVAFGIFRGREFKRIQKILLILGLIFYWTSFHLTFLKFGENLPYAICTLGCVSALALFFASMGRQKIFQLFLGLILLRFLVLYFQALGGLAATGIGLIVSGLLVIGLAVLWNKYRVRLAMWAERWAA